MRLSTTTTRTRILALPLLLLLLLLMVAVAVTNATPLPPSPSPPPSDFSEIEARWAVGQTEVSTCYMLHVVRFTEQQQQQRTRKRTTRAAEKYTYTNMFTALRLFIILTSTNQPTCLSSMYCVHTVVSLTRYHSKKSTPARVFERVKLLHGLLLVSLEEEEEKKLRGLRRRWILGVWLVLRRRGGGGGAGAGGGKKKVVLVGVREMMMFRC